MVIGFNMTFFVQHFLGLMGMPRRVYTYPDLPGWATLNLVSTVGAFVMGLSVLVLLYNLGKSLRSGQVAGDNPWDAWTLEWATTSPPQRAQLHRGAAGPRPPPALRPRTPLEGRARSRAPKERVFDKGASRGVDVHRVRGELLRRPHPRVRLLQRVPRAGRRALGARVARRAEGRRLHGLPARQQRHALALREGARREGPRRANVWLALTIALGGVFIVGQAREYLALTRAA